MKEKLWVISLGGSRIVPGEVDEEFLIAFKKLIDSHSSHKFVVVTGGGTTARKYISALRRVGKRTKDQSLAGIAVTRLHAGFMARFFGRKANEIIPENMKKVKSLLSGNQIVFCGGLRYRRENTSDGTAAKLAAYLGCPFINLTNVRGLYTADPSKDKKAKFVAKISWKDFNKITEKIKYQAGQHFVLDKVASETILKEKIPTYIVGNLKPIDNIIRGKKFEGTLISG
jgi:uridylate kinase